MKLSSDWLLWLFLSVFMGGIVILTSWLFYKIVRDNSRKKIDGPAYVVSLAISGMTGIWAFFWSEVTFQDDLMRRVFMGVVCGGLLLLASWMLGAILQATIHGFRDYLQTKRFMERVEGLTNALIKRIEPHPLDAKAEALQDRLLRMYTGGFEEDDTGIRDMQGLLYCWSELIRARTELESRKQDFMALGAQTLDALEILISRLENRNGYGR